MSQRGRPAKAADEIEMSKNLAQEIRKLSGMTSEQISEVLGKHVALSIGVWRQYTCGAKAMSRERMRNIASIAWANGWRGQWIRLALLSTHPDSHETIEVRQSRIMEMQAIFENLLDGDLQDDIERLDLMIQAARHAAIRAVGARLREDPPDIEEEILAKAATERYHNNFFIPLEPGRKGGFGSSVPKPKFLKES